MDACQKGRLPGIQALSRSTDGNAALHTAGGLLSINAPMQLYMQLLFQLNQRYSVCRTYLARLKVRGIFSQDAIICAVAAVIKAAVLARLCANGGRALLVHEMRLKRGIALLHCQHPISKEVLSA